MKVCIAEKPSVARDIASILGATTRRDGFYEGNGYCVTWVFGHLCTLKEPGDYTPLWKTWALSQLPMIPEKFSIKLIHDAGVERQFKVIETLISQADEVINCGDAGQEGELIQRWVMQKASVKCPVSRLWISSLTDESIRKGFASLRPEADFNNLYYAGLSRAIGDWILGMNATRLYTLKYSSGNRSVLSIGRVQTPTLSLIVQRHREIEQFKSEDFWELKTVYRDASFNARCERFMKQEEIDAAIAAIAPSPLVIDSIEEKQGREAPPRLFDLTSLQVECNKRWGWTADHTLAMIQSLYEKKVTTYPRVDTTYLTTDIRATIPDVMARMTPYATLTAPVIAAPITQSKRIFDNSKVTDHHAIIPTGESPRTLVGDERQLYHLIALRFIAAFYPDCIFMQTTVFAHTDTTTPIALPGQNRPARRIDFRAGGKVITVEGWRTVLTPNKDDGVSTSATEGDESSLLPAFSQGEQGQHKPFAAKKATQPPKPYTEGTLLRAMESAGKTVEDEELREAMKENGIGRPSTRSAIIETLFRRHYIQRQRKNILPTEAGIALIDTINEELLKSAKLTGLWENKLRRIERGEYSAAEFISELKQQISKIVLDVLSDNSAVRIQAITASPTSDKKGKTAGAKSKSGSASNAASRAASSTSGNTSDSSSGTSNSGDSGKTKRAKPVKSLDQIACPLCGSGHILKGRAAYGCSNYASGCSLRLPFEQYPAELTPAKLNQKLKKQSHV